MLLRNIFFLMLAASLLSTADSICCHESPALDSFQPCVSCCHGEDAILGVENWTATEPAGQEQEMPRQPAGCSALIAQAIEHPPKSFR